MIQTSRKALSRRSFLAGTAGATIAGSVAPDAQAGKTESGFAYDVTRTDREWRARLSDREFRILREGKTEDPFSSPLVANDRPGTYCCRGCDLTVYDQAWQVYPEKGWVFFRHSEPNATLTGIDGNPYIGDADVREFTLIEAHCRRCGSHLGHVLTVDGETLHCINGTALRFEASDA